ncbi:MAG TPA: CYTH domain-containing protein [Candidatus Paceibacterota bacterium]
MQTEIEAKFTDIDVAATRAGLRRVGAELLQAETLMRRRVYEHPTGKENDWFRVRDEGNRVTMSYKKLEDRTLHGTKEIVFEVPSFDDACRFLEAAHVRFVSYQETKRETWRLGGADITIDTWPWIPTFLEIEAPTEEGVRATAEALGLDMAAATYGSVENVYTAHYDVTETEVCDWPEITFTHVPAWLAAKRNQKN